MYCILHPTKLGILNRSDRSLRHDMQHVWNNPEKRIHFFEEKPNGKRTLKRPRRTWQKNNKIDLKEMGCDPRNWMELAKDKDQWRDYVRAVMNNRVP